MLDQKQVEMKVQANQDLEQVTKLRFSENVCLKMKRKVKGWCKRYILSISHDLFSYRERMVRNLRGGNSGYKASTTILLKLTGLHIASKLNKLPKRGGASAALIKEPTSSRIRIIVVTNFIL